MQSSNYPDKYKSPAPGVATKTCNWFITVKPAHQILLSFSIFILEGNPPSKYFAFSGFSAVISVDFLY